MARRNKRDSAGEGRPLSGAWQRAEGEWLVRDISASAAVKPYRCPGCDHEIAPGVPHIVAWPAGTYGSVTDRRHWHRHCWTTRTH